jgi:hypothetical protein
MKARTDHPHRFARAETNGSKAAADSLRRALGLLEQGG